MKRTSTPIKALMMSGRHRLLFVRLFMGVLCGGILSFFFSDSSLLETLEIGMLEWRYEIADKWSKESWLPKGESRAVQSICIVTFDDASQFDMGFARFNDQLSQLKLSLLINKIEDSRPKPLLVVVDLDLRGAANTALVETLSRYNNVVLSLFGNMEGSTDLPSAEFLSHSASYGYHELSKEPGGMVLRLPDQEHGSDQEKIIDDQMPSLTRAALSAYKRLSGVDYPSKMIPEQPDQFAYINYRNTSYPSYSMSSVLAPDFDSSVFKNKIVLIGSTLTPRKQDPERAKVPFHKEQPELIIHADALATVMNNDIIWSFPRSYTKQFLLIIGALSGALSSSLSSWRRFLFMLIGAGVLLLLAQLAFQFFHLALPVVSPLALIGSGFILGTVIYLDTDLRQRNKELAAAREMMQVRAEEERKRIAEDLHDETLPALSSIARMVDDMGVDFAGNPVPGKMREKLDETIQEMRRVINDLHPSVLETMGFLPALENLVRILGRETGLETTFQASSNFGDNEIPDFAKLQLYRIVQEALNNVRKHSQATFVSVDVSKLGDNLEIIVIDNGRGIDPSLIRPDSHGLLNIRHRAALIGAYVEWQRPRKYMSGTEFRTFLEVRNED